MISHFARLRAKKGFTLIELIVVISIIGILLAMVIPIVSYDRKPAIARSMAREIYYRSSEVMTDCKAADLTIPTTPSSTYTCFYAEIDSLGRAVETGIVYVDGSGTITEEEVFGSSINSGIKFKMKSMFENYVTDEVVANMSGHLIAVVDSHYRVVASYWLENFTKPYTGQGMEAFVEDCVLSTGQYCTSYPVYLSLVDSRMFVVDRVLGTTSD